MARANASLTVWMRRRADLRLDLSSNAHHYILYFLQLWFSSSPQQVHRVFFQDRSRSERRVVHTPPVTIYMGKDKVESACVPHPLASNTLYLTFTPDEDLIKYAWPQDVWFHVDKLSSAHVYLRLPDNIPSWDAIPEVLLQDCAQLVKANSIEGARREW